MNGFEKNRAELKADLLRLETFLTIRHGGINFHSGVSKVSDFVSLIPRFVGLPNIPHYSSFDKRIKNELKSVVAHYFPPLDGMSLPNAREFLSNYDTNIFNYFQKHAPKLKRDELNSVFNAAMPFYINAFSTFVNERNEIVIRNEFSRANVEFQEPTGFNTSDLVKLQKSSEELEDWWLSSFSLSNDELTLTLSQTPMQDLSSVSVYEDNRETIRNLSATFAILEQLSAPLGIDQAYISATQSLLGAGDALNNIFEAGFEAASYVDYANVVIGGLSALSAFGVFGKNNRDDGFKTILNAIKALSDFVADFRREVREQFEIVNQKLDFLANRLIEVQLTLNRIGNDVSRILIIAEKTYDYLINKEILDTNNALRIIEDRAFDFPYAFPDAFTVSYQRKCMQEFKEFIISKLYIPHQLDELDINEDLFRAELRKEPIENFAQVLFHPYGSEPPSRIFSIRLWAKSFLSLCRLIKSSSYYGKEKQVLRFFSGDLIEFYYKGVDLLTRRYYSQLNIEKYFDSFVKAPSEDKKTRLLNEIFLQIKRLEISCPHLIGVKGSALNDLEELERKVRSINIQDLTDKNVSLIEEVALYIKILFVAEKITPLRSPSPIHRMIAEELNSIGIKVAVPKLIEDDTDWDIVDVKEIKDLLNDGALLDDGDSFHGHFPDTNRWAKNGIGIHLLSWLNLEPHSFSISVPNDLTQETFKLRFEQLPIKVVRAFLRGGNDVDLFDFILRQANNATTAKEAAATFIVLNNYARSWINFPKVKRELSLESVSNLIRHSDSIYGILEMPYVFNECIHFARKVGKESEIYQDLYLKLFDSLRKGRAFSAYNEQTESLRSLNINISAEEFRKIEDLESYLNVSVDNDERLIISDWGIYGSLTLFSACYSEYKYAGMNNYLSYLESKEPVMAFIMDWCTTSLPVTVKKRLMYSHYINFWDSTI